MRGLRGRDVFERQVMPAAFKSHDGDYLALARDVLRVMSRGMHLQTEVIDLFFELSAGRILHGERHKEAWNEYMKWNADYIFTHEAQLTRRLLSRMHPKLAEKAKETGIWEFLPSDEHVSWDENTRLKMSMLEGFYPTVG